ncbi:MAG: hypothetical protein U0103_29515 [Candidatus Obscuribacterales bacterium]
MNNSGTQNLESDIQTAINTAVITVASDFGTPVSVFHNLSQLERRISLIRDTVSAILTTRFTIWISIRSSPSFSGHDGVA